jgi:hypothetical protein
MAEERCYPEAETARVTGLSLTPKMKNKPIACTGTMSICRLKIATSSELVEKFLSREWCAGGLLTYHTLLTNDQRHLRGSFPKKGPVEMF